MGKFRRNALTALILSSLAALPGYSIAQDAPPPAEPPAPQAGETEEATTLEGVVVKGEIVYRNRTDTTAPELVYDQEFFAQFEPVSVGDQLRRVPGVAFTSDIGESDSPQLRGLGQGYTQILVNGRPLPGAGNDRTVFVDRIPAEIVDRIEIIRSPSADIDSQGVGGTINIILKDGASLPPGVVARIGATYNTEAGNTRGNVSASWSGRNKEEDVFWSLTVDAQERYNNKDVVQEVFEEDSVGFDEEVSQGGDGRSLVRFDDPEDSVAIERTEEQDSRDTRDLSLNTDVTWQINDASSVRFDAFLLSTDRREHQDTINFEGDGSVGGLELDDGELEFQDAHFQQDSGGIAGVYEHDIDDVGKFELTASYSKFTDDSVEETFEEEADNLVDRESIDTDDAEWTYGASITGDLAGFATAMGIDGAEFKVGIAGKIKDRDYRLTVEEGLDEDDYETSDGFFRYKERRLDGYARMKFVFNPAVTLEAGVRAESTSSEQDFRTDFLEGGELDESVSGGASSDEFMLNPSAHLQWKLTDNDQLRFSAAKTVRRPSIEQLVPAYSLESPGDEDVTIGNPNLSFETALGFDIGYERRFGRTGVMGLNFFYRDIDDLIGLVSTGESVSEIGLDDEDFPGGLYRYENIGKAKTHGFEFDLSTPLSFMGLDETGVFANYTRLWSDRDDPAGTGEEIEIDFQPKYIYNVGITQNIPSWEASFGLSYQKQGESRFVTYGEIESQTYDGNLEFFAEKRIGKRAVIRLTGNNLLNAASNQAEAGFDGDSGEEILENQAAYNVDAFEVEREKSSPRWTLTLRLVF